MNKDFLNNSSLIRKSIDAQSQANQNLNISDNNTLHKQESLTNKRNQRDSSTNITNYNDDQTNQFYQKQGSSISVQSQNKSGQYRNNNNNSNIMMQSSSVKNESLEKKLMVPEYSKNERKIESYVSNRFIPASSLNFKEYDDSMLLTDANIDRALLNNQDDRDNNNHLFNPTSFMNNNNFDSDDSLTQSYNQKVKEDTNFLAKQKNLEYDEHNDNSRHKIRNDSDAYNLNTRQSYAYQNQNQQQQSSYTTNHKKSYDLEPYDAQEFIPLEYHDSDAENVHIQINYLSEGSDIQVVQKIIQKINSIGGIRKLYYIFKHQRRELLQKEKNKFTSAYQDLCYDYLKRMESQRDNNLNYILHKINGFPQQKFIQLSAKIDKDYHALIGLGRKVKIPQNLSLDQAKEIKLKLQERVMELWNQYQVELRSKFDMEMLLTILECYAEDQMYKEYEFDIDQIEKLISKEHIKATQDSISVHLSTNDLLQNDDSFNDLENFHNFPSSVSQHQNDVLLGQSDLNNNNNNNYDSYPIHSQVQQLLDQINSQQPQKCKESLNRMSVKNAVRMSIFTIAEEEDDSQDEQ